MKLVGADWRNDAKFAASNGIKGEFAMFMRKSEYFPENFSVGLRYNPHDDRGEITLLRCNGKHGDFNGSFDPNHPHWDYHIHRATETAIEAGQAPEKDAVIVTEYASFEEAIQFFVRTINLTAKDAQKHFPAKTRTDFAFDE